MHYVRVMITHCSMPEGEQWVTHAFREDELPLLLAHLTDWERRNVPFEQQFTHDPAGPTWCYEHELEVEQEMAEEADEYNPEGEWF